MAIWSIAPRSVSPARVGARVLLTVGICVSGLVTVLVQAQDPLAGATLFNAHISGYVAGFYDKAPEPPARWVFYQGEKVEGSVGFQNEAKSTMLMVTVPADSGFRNEWLLVPEEARGMNLPEPVSSDGIQIQIGTAAQRVFPSDRVVVPPGGSIATTFILETQQLPVGLYRLVLHPVGWEVDRRALPGWNTMTFEIRDGTPLPSALDALARQVHHAIRVRDFRQANAFVNEMLQLNRDAVLAFNLRGQIAYLAGRESEAAQAKATAGQIVREHRDSLYESRPRSPGIQ